MAWADHVFPDAEDPNDVGWMISYWRITPKKCKGCKSDYALESRQFDHLGISATREEALAKLDFYINQKRTSGKAKSIKGLILFLTKVEKIVVISDKKGDIQ